MRSLTLAALSGLAYCAAFPPMDAGLVAWVALVPLIVAAAEVPVGRGFVLGWITGTIACNGLTSPSILAALTRAGHPLWLGALEAFVIPQLCGALYFGAFGAYVAALSRRRVATATWCLALAAAWVVGEVARSRVGHGMPWVLLAHSQAGMPTILQVADLAGASGVAFVVAIVNAAVAALARRGLAASRRWPAALIAASVVAGAITYGRVQLARWEAPAGTQLDIVLIQGDIPGSWRRSLARLPDVLARYRALIGDAVRGGSDLVILPENAAGIAAAVDARVVEEMTAPLAGTDTRLLFGAPRTVQLAPGRATIRNSAYLVDATRTIIGTYDKRHLVPFGEASTWLLPARLAEHLGLDEPYSAGHESTLLHVRDQPFATLICWESIYAEAGIDAVRDGATFLVNLSNDDWFDGRAAREQHFRATMLRAVETRRYLVRVTNSGVTGVVDPRGMMVVTVPSDVAIGSRARITAETGRTPYVRVGDAFAWLCVLGAVFVLRRRAAAPSS